MNTSLFVKMLKDKADALASGKPAQSLVSETDYAAAAAKMAKNAGKVPGTKEYDELVKKFKDNMENPPNGNGKKEKKEGEVPPQFKKKDDKNGDDDKDDKKDNGNGDTGKNGNGNGDNGKDKDDDEKDKEEKECKECGNKFEGDGELCPDCEKKESSKKKSAKEMIDALIMGEDINEIIQDYE